MKSYLALLLAVFSSAHAATIAVVDSGLDYTHEMISPRIWVNPDYKNEGDVLYGWNFVESNNQIFDFSHSSLFSPENNKFYRLLAKASLKGLTPEERIWYASKFSDKKFISQVNVYGTYVHGTHVSGIAVKNSSHKVMGIKLLQTDVRGLSQKLNWNLKSVSSAAQKKQIQYYLTYLAVEQMVQMEKVGRLLNYYKVDIMNGSYGVGKKDAKALVLSLYNSLKLKAPTEEEQNEYATFFLNALAEAGKSFVATAPHALFVFAAGNDGSDNDVDGFSPSNIKADNTISVAATFENYSLASFSNWGAKMVEIAAPGTYIDSAVPGNEYIPVSGTSQAAPLVANIAGKVKDINTSLRPAEIKKILMGTVDVKSFLLGKVKSGGIVNSERAEAAARYSLNMPLDKAIKASFEEVPVQLRLFKSRRPQLETMAFPMPSPFSF